MSWASARSCIEKNRSFPSGVKWPFFLDCHHYVFHRMVQTIRRLPKYYLLPLELATIITNILWYRKLRKYNEESDRRSTFICKIVSPIWGEQNGNKPIMKNKDVDRSTCSKRRANQESPSRRTSRRKDRICFRRGRWFTGRAAARRKWLSRGWQPPGFA